MSALMLTACAVSAPSSRAPIDLPVIPSKFISTSCTPTALPSTALSKADVEKLWARDRAKLVKCGFSLGGLIAFYEDLSRRLHGTH